MGQIGGVRKVGCGTCTRQKPRLIGDSGANRVSRIHEHVRLPGLQGIQRFLSMPAAQERHGRVSCVFFNFDSKLVTSNGDCVHAAKLFTQVLRVQRTLLLLLTVPESAVGGCLLDWKSCRNK